MEDGAQFVHRDGLYQVLVHSRVQAYLAFAVQRTSGERDDRNAYSRRLAVAYGARCCIPVELRHLTVHQDHVVRQSLPQIEGLDTVGRHIDPAPETHQ